MLATLMKSECKPQHNVIPTRYNNTMSSQQDIILLLDWDPVTIIVLRVMERARHVFICSFIVILAKPYGLVVV